MEHAACKIALAGNPNVGKSTIFNGLTGLKQHTGNWSGVTVAAAKGEFKMEGHTYITIDLPGTYSLTPCSAEEQITRDYLLSGDADLVMIVCDATCIERGLHLLKEVLSLESILRQSTPIVLCINLCDEADKKGITINCSLLEHVLQIPVICCCARKPKDLRRIKETIHTAAGTSTSCHCLDFSPKQLAQEVTLYAQKDYLKRQRRMDRLITAPVTGGLIMLSLLLGIFWLTIAGANYPADLLWQFLFSLEEPLLNGLTYLSLAPAVIDALVYGVYRVLAWVVAVMFPPMAIFFPLFTLLEDLGYLPRIAFYMDRAFHRCRACGKQCLTMAMGFGCNAAGVTGCRIIDSPRERLIAILTNCLVPCNGRFPLLITMITLFFLTGPRHTFAGALMSALLLTAFILLGIGATLFCSWLLSHTLLKGIPSTFILELPPYRKPQIGKVLIRSLLDRTAFVLGRAAAAAAPAGLFIWLLANITINSTSLLHYLTGFLDPLGRLMGLDGVILGAFLLGFPANEIIIPIILMTYLQTGHLVEMNDSAALLDLLTTNGWTIKTAICMILFSLFHWPCSTTCLTIKKETGSVKWTIVAILIPTLLGFLVCVLMNLFFTLFYS